MLAPFIALTMMLSPCTMTIGISHTGGVFARREQGWFRSSDKSLQLGLAGGCYNDANPARVSSVRLVIAPHAPSSRVEAIYKLLEKNGWPHDKVNVEPWPDDRKPPR